MHISANMHMIPTPNPRAQSRAQSRGTSRRTSERTPRTRSESFDSEKRHPVANPGLPEIAEDTAEITCDVISTVSTQV